MGYYLHLTDPVSHDTLTLDQPHHMRGGTYCVGGSYEASMNVTYNYGKHYYRAFPGEEGIRTLYGMTGAESIPLLKGVIDQLGDDSTESYWDGTEGNAKRALCNLLALAQMRPDGVWDGD